VKESLSHGSASAWRPRLSPKARLRRDRLDGRCLLVFPEAALVLNESARRILELCDGKHTLDDIVAVVGRSYRQTPAETIAGDVRDFLERLRQRGLLEAAE
jgi:pyrroloquinoline quinone biosynthesis protein D